ncbi:MAG: polysaccharide export protein [Proteobacteria bacterium]|nr:polysaccharide export protein [Pseudomonadota bacterium]
MLDRVIHFVLAMALAYSAAACADPPPSAYPAQQVYVEDTTLGPGDAFEVRVFRQDDLTGAYNVNSEGTISFPLIGVVEVRGKTPVEVEREIRERLAAGYLRDPQVSLLVKEYNSKKISVFGQVRRPGTLPFTAGMTVVDAVAQAGGFAELARKNAVTVTRVDGGKKHNYIIPVESIGEGKADNFYVRPGDTVFVPRRAF